MSEHHELNNNREKTPQPDGPVMRSVMLARPATSGSLIGIPPPRSFSATIKTTPEKTIQISNTSPWQLSRAQPLPAMYPLERCHLYIKGVDSQTVANRVSTCLAKQSIHATYHESTCSADTCSHLQFSIQLFSSLENSIVCQIQRRSGCCIEFHKTARLVLQAASGIQEEEKKKTLKLPKCCLAIPPEEQERLNRDALDLARGLLEDQDRLDHLVMGMESLAFLAKKSPQFVADQVLAKPESVVYKTLVRLLLSSQEESESLNELERSCYDKAHSCALDILAHASSVLLEDDSLLLQRLVHQLSRAQDEPHKACLAARCLLKYVQQQHKDIASLQDAMDQARSCRHDDLQQATQQLEAAVGR